MFFRSLLTAASACVVLCAPALAQSPYDLLPVPDGPVNAMAVVGDTLYFGGDFDFLGPRVGPATALDPATGAVVPGVVPAVALGPYASRGIEEAVSDGAGGVFLGGPIAEAGGLPRINLVHVLADGTVDPGFAPNPRSSNWDGGPVERLVLADSVLFVIGGFTEIAGVARDGFAALDARTGAALSFSPTLVSPDSTYDGFVRSVAMRDGVVLVSGAFVAINGVARPGLAALDLATGAVLPWTLTFQADYPYEGRVYDLVPAGETVYLVGWFTGIDGEPRDGMAEIAFPTATDTAPALTPWAPAFDLPSDEFLLSDIRDVVLTDGALWLAGVFIDRGYPHPIITPLLRFSRDDAAAHGQAVVIDPGIAPGTYDWGFYREGTAVATDGTTVWFSASVFNGYRGTQSHVVGVDAATAEPTGFRVVTGPLSSASAGEVHVQAMAYTVGPEGGRLVVAGHELKIGNDFPPFYGAVDLTTGAMLPPPAEPFTEAIRTLVPSSDGRRLYVGTQRTGKYVEVDLATGARTPFTVPFQGGAAVRDSSAAPPTGPPLYTARQNGGGLSTPERLYLRGETGTFGRNILRALDPQTLRPLPEFDFEYGPRYIADLALADGWLYVSGSFTRLGDDSDYQKYVRVDPTTGAPDPSWRPMQGPVDGQAGGPMAFADSLFVTGGVTLHRAFGQEIENVVAFARPGGALAPFAGTVYGSDVDDLQYGGGVFYVSGHLTEINGQSRRNLAAWDRAGEVLDWPTEQPLDGVGILVSERHARVFVSGTGDVGNGREHLGSFPAALGVTPPVAGEPAAPPTDVALDVFPNPARGTARLALTLPAEGAVSVAVYDLLGRRVAAVHDGPLGAGAHALTLDVRRLAPGVYVVRVQAGGAVLSRRVTVLR